ncbi:FMN phosphatase YigB, HAD superfamily [Desulfonispora thiosulfatigenes DSM 11270]|uniref:FMN phosphatase YigB, HAD superfamily n=1 Tax=Desulfonispora thiosulfatigenes DSM 11270 TaxID=656914 RepID=A0A1W1V7T7_DESTI|nr:HAD family hydrolase [Desulfonispora thiosulfatigenes]SMB89333.1 FMN phosphatase YigB, HAD superfamily [Desulfonispora thiosulfatigenes DSM 11270]
MFKAVLFDLDGTLLPFDLDYFVKNYFESLADYCKDYVDPKSLIKNMGISLDAMLKNTGEITNEEMFMQTFLPALNKGIDEMYPLFEKFYLEEFPNLKKYTEYNALSSEITKEVMKKGYKTALATNPVFPRQATLHRMDWAGIKDLPWDLVTTYEDFYTCKPNLAYFEDVCDRLSVNPKDCIMIGNDAQEDLAASELGMKTFLVKDCLIDRKNTNYKPDYVGTLDDVYQFIKQLP